MCVCVCEPHQHADVPCLRFLLSAVHGRGHYCSPHAARARNHTNNEQWVRATPVATHTRIDETHSD